MYRHWGKVKCTLVQALRLCTGLTAHRGSRGIALPFHDHGTRNGEGSASRPGRSLRLGKTRYPLYKRLGGPQGRQVRKIWPPPPKAFNPRTVQPVASRYTINLITCIKIHCALLESIYVLNFYGPQEGRTLRKCYSPPTLPNLSHTEIVLSSIFACTKASLCGVTSVGLNELR